MADTTPLLWTPLLWATHRATRPRRTLTAKPDRWRFPARTGIGRTADQPESSMPRLNDFRPILLACALAVILSPTTGLAQTQAPDTATTPGPVAPRVPSGQGRDPVIGSVDGKLICLSNLTRRSAT